MAAGGPYDALLDPHVSSIAYLLFSPSPVLFENNLEPFQWYLAVGFRPSVFEVGHLCPKSGIEVSCNTRGAGERVCDVSPCLCSIIRLVSAAVLLWVGEVTSNKATCPAMNSDMILHLRLQVLIASQSGPLTPCCLAMLVNIGIALLAECTPCSIHHTRKAMRASCPLCCSNRACLSWSHELSLVAHQMRGTSWSLRVCILICRASSVAN